MARQSEGSQPESISHALDVFSGCNIFLTVSVFGLGSLVSSLSEIMGTHRSTRIEVQLRAALTAMVFKKSLTVDFTSLAEGAGTVNNLISVDVLEISLWLCTVHYLWYYPLTVAIALVLLYFILGISSIAGILVMIFSLSLATWASGYLDKHQTLQFDYKDERIGIICELLSSIRIIKVNRVDATDTYTKFTSAT